MSKLGCLYICRFAPIRTQTDPYTGLPWYLSQRVSLTCVWNRPERGKVGFKCDCENVLEVVPGIKGWLRKLWHVLKMTVGTLRPDVVVCGVDEHSLSLGVVMSKIAGIPVFAVAEDPPFTNRYDGQLSMRRRIERCVRLKLVHALLESCDGVFCFVEKNVLNDFYVGRTRVYQMMNGVSHEARKWMWTRTQPVRDNGEFVIGLVGALAPEQGLQTVLQITAGAREYVQNLKLRLIGPMKAEHAETFREELYKLRLDSIVEVTGWLPYHAMLEKLYGCSVGVYCNPDTDWFRVAQPLKICEYLALEKPTIAWDYPGIRRLLDNGHCGILVPAGDEQAFIGAVVRLSDPVVHGRIACQIRESVDERWSSDYWYEQVLQVLAKTQEGVQHGSPP